MCSFGSASNRVMCTGSLVGGSDVGRSSGRTIEPDSGMGNKLRRRMSLLDEKKLGRRRREEARTGDFANGRNERGCLINNPHTPLLLGHIDILLGPLLAPPDELQKPVLAVRLLERVVSARSPVGKVGTRCFVGLRRVARVERLGPRALARDRKSVV